MYRFLLLTFFVNCARSEYNCICFYNAERKIYATPSVTSNELGLLYEFDCKQTLATDTPTGWAQIAYMHQVGYIQMDGSTQTQICSGVPIDTDTINATMQPIVMTSTKVEPKTMTSATMQTTTMLPTTMLPTSMLPTTMQPTTMQPTTMQPTTVESTTMQPTTMESTTMQPTTMESTTMQPTTMQPTTMESTTMQSTTMQPTTMQPTTMQPTTMEPTTMQPSTAAMSSTPEMTTPLMSSIPTTQMAGEGCPMAVRQEAQVNNSLLIVNHLEHKCYEFVQTRHYWTTSESYCKRHGGHLVTIRNANENMALHEYVKAYGQSVWIGYSDRIKEDTFTWTSGETGSYTNWRTGHRNSFIHGSEDCVCMLASSGEWEDLGCSSSYAYICEYASVPDVSGQALGNPALNSDGNIRMCPASILLAERTHPENILGQYGDSCYELINGSQVTWTLAEGHCKRNGGHLAHIRNVDEQNYIVDFLMRHSSNLATWIGLTDSNSEGNFKWTSGEPVTYTNWMSGFNGTHHSSEDCVVLLPNNTGKWDEVYCGSHGGIFSSRTERHQQLCQYKTVTHSTSLLIG